MRRLPDRSGFALVTVLWILVLAGGIAAGFQAAAQAERRAAANVAASAQARWAARGGLARALALLERRLQDGGGGSGAEPSPSAPMLPAQQFTIGELDVTVVAIDVRSRLSLNTADEEQLRALFAALGIPGSEAEPLAHAVLDWRDPDDVPRTSGAEAGHYRRRGPALPGNAPFGHVEQLRDVLGVTPQRYALIAPHVGVSDDSVVNLNSASLAVLQTLPGMSRGAASVVVARRTARPFRNPFTMLAALPKEFRLPIEQQMDAFVARTEFSARDVELVATAAVPGAVEPWRVTALVRLSGGSRWDLVSLVER